MPKSMRRRNVFYDDDEEEVLLSLITADIFSGSERKRGGSCVGRNPNLPRAHQIGHLRIIKDYFNDNPVYNDRLFRRRFRMRRSLFLSIATAVAEHDIYFTQRPVNILHSSIPNLRVREGRLLEASQAY